MVKVIKFYADWCGPCKVYAKTFDKVVEDFDKEVKSGEIEFINVNVENDPEGLTKEWKVASIPTTVVIKDGFPYRQVGRMSEEDLKSTILGE